MKNVKKILAVVMAVAMIFALSIPAFATGNILSAATSFIPGSLYSQTAAKGNTIYLYATITTDDYPASLIGFSSLSDAAANVSWSITSGSGKVSSITWGGDSFVYNNTTYYMSKCTVVLDSNATPGMVVINAAGQNGAPTNTDCNYVIVIEDEDAETDSVSDITIRVRDLTTNTEIALDTNVTVACAKDDTSYVFNGSAGAAQCYATAANTIDNLLIDTVEEEIESGAVTSVVATYGYVSSITAENASGVSTVYSESYNPLTYDYIGWMYGVLRTVGNTTYYVSASEGISATVFELQDGDTVVWAYGTFAQVSSYFGTFPSI